MIGLGGCLLKLERYDEAERCLADGLKHVRETRSSQYKLLLKALDRLGELYKATGESDKEAACRDQISEIRVAHPPVDR